jgi:S-DNA-T family DNA segregation ATPase FtsK/SpoIIIE
MVKRVPSKAEKKFKDEFYDLMTYMGMLNVYNRTYKLHILDETNYGYFAHIYLAPGLSFDTLQEKRKVIEQNLKCLWIMKVEQFKEYAEVQIVTVPIDKELEYENPKIKPWETYLGLSFSKRVIKNDNNDKCMFMLAGATGSGKTRFIYMILLSWILSCSPTEVRLYISDIAKNEYAIFKRVKHVKRYASELDELCGMMQELKKEFLYRKKIISGYLEEGKVANIYDYNKLGKDKLPYCYILIDEFSILTVDKSDPKEEKQAKEFVLDTIKMLEKTGRSYGMFCFVATQKTTKEEIGVSVIKNMSAVRLSFRANDLISSEVIVGNEAAVGLADRIAVYSQNGGEKQDYLFSPKLTIERLNELLKPYIKTEQKPAVKGKPGLQRGKVTPIPKRLAATGTEAAKVINLFKQEDDFIDY